MVSWSAVRSACSAVSEVNSSCIRTSPVSSPPSTIAVSVADSNNISVLGLETTPSQQSRGHSIRSFGVTAGSTFIVSERRPRNITSTSTDLWVMQSMAPMSRIDFWLTGTSHRRELIEPQKLLCPRASLNLEMFSSPLPPTSSTSDDTLPTSHDTGAPRCEDSSSMLSKHRTSSA